MTILFQPAFDIDLKFDPLWCAWFTGWVDGEGCFISQIHNDSLAITPVLTVSLREDDRNILREVKETLRCGVLYEKSRKHDRENGKGCKDQIAWKCGSLGQCRHILIPLFDKYPLRSKKARDYKIWRELVLGISEGHHLNRNRDYILDLCRQLKEIKRY
mgnify:CR=1 FL=1